MAAVEDLIQDARTYASESNDAAVDLVQAAQEAISGFQPFSGFGGVTLTPLEPDPMDTEIPQFQIPELQLPPAPTAPSSYENLPALDAGEVPQITAVAPSFDEPARPAPLRDFTASVPDVLTDFVFPEPPPELEQVTFLPPEIADRTAPAAPQLQIPVFEATSPGSAPEAPTALDADFAAAFAAASQDMRSALSGELDAFLARINPQFHAQMATLESRLAQYAAGGTALPADIEDAIFERGRAKVSAEYRRLMDEAYSEAANRGFTIPPGAVYSGLRRARQGAADANARTAVDIAIKQAELEQQNIQFALTLSKDLRATALNASLAYHGNLINLNGQALAYAQALLDAMVQVYNLQVEGYKARLEGYRAEAAVYETRMRAALALADIYRSEIEALKALTDVDMAKVRLYEARLQGLQMLAATYKTRVEAVAARASLERLKLDLFGAQVQLYEAESRGKSSEWQAYSAALGGQEAKMRAFAEQVRAQGLQVDAFRAKVDALRSQVQSVTDYNRGLADRYVAEMNGYRAHVQAQGEVASTALDINRAQLQAVQAQFGAKEARAKVDLEYYKTATMTFLEAYRTQVQQLLESGRLNQEQIKSIAQVALSGAKVYEGLASSALSGINTLVSQQLTE